MKWSTMTLSATTKVSMTNAWNFWNPVFLATKIFVHLFQNDVYTYIVHPMLHNMFDSK